MNTVSIPVGSNFTLLLWTLSVITGHSYNADADGNFESTGNKFKIIRDQGKWTPPCWGISSGNPAFRPDDTRPDVENIKIPTTGGYKISLYSIRQYL
ncbi:MAG: hypothetical protein ACRCR9_04460 [Chitinophagaceae bacterium]